MSKQEKIFIPLYILFAILSFLYVKDVLKEEYVKSKPEEKSEKMKQEFYDLTLILDYRGARRIYKQEAKNVNSVLDLLQKVRDEHDFSFEVEKHTDKLVIRDVNGLSTFPNESWRVYYKDEDITNSINDINLSDDGTYNLILEAD